MTEYGCAVPVEVSDPITDADVRKGIATAAQRFVLDVETGAIPLDAACRPVTFRAGPRLDDGTVPFAWYIDHA